MLNIMIKNKKWIGIIAILLSISIIFLIAFIKNHGKSDTFFGAFLNEMYNISYDEYMAMIEDKGSDMETFLRRDKFEKFFTPEGFENFIANRLSVLYLHEVIGKQCDVELASYSGKLEKEPYKYWYTYKADKFFYKYEVLVNVISLKDGTKTRKSEIGAVSGYIIDDNYKIDSVKIYHQIFK